MDDRIFIGVFSTGIGYADRTREVQGDFAKLAFLTFSKLELITEPNCPSALAEQIRAHAAEIQARRGEQYRISTAGQTITLGYALESMASRCAERVESIPNTRKPS